MPTSIDIEAYLNSLEKEYLPRARAAALRGVDVFGEFLLGESQQICPQSPTDAEIPGAGAPHGKDEIKNPRFTGHSGFLRGSATSEPAVQVGTDIQKSIGYNADYAAAVHENLEAHHDEGTQAKFLETPMRQHADKLVPYVLDELKKEFG
jgi:hypothetical protein